MVSASKRAQLVGPKASVPGGNSHPSNQGSQAAQVKREPQVKQEQTDTQTVAPAPATAPARTRTRAPAPASAARGRATQKKVQTQPKKTATRSGNTKNRVQKTQPAKTSSRRATAANKAPTRTAVSDRARKFNGKGGETPSRQQLGHTSTSDVPASAIERAKVHRRAVEKPGTVANKQPKVGGLHAAQKLGKRWITAEGYDGPLLPQPPLTDMLPSRSYNQLPGRDQRGILALLAVAEGKHSSAPTWTAVDREAYSKPLGAKLMGPSPNNKNYDVYLHQNANQGYPTTTKAPIPSLRRVVRNYPEIENTQDEHPEQIPNMEMFLSSTVGSLPPLSQTYLAYHVVSASIPDSNMMFSRASHVTRTKDEENATDEIWTPRNVHQNRLTNRGHSNGFKSFADLVQADMESSSLSHFSIMKGRPRTTVTRRAMMRRRAGGNDDVNIFQKMVKRPELVILLAKHLRVQELLILFSISKPFNEIVSSRITTVMLSQALMRAPDSARIFPFRCYSKLCIRDPGLRPHPIAEKAAAGELRKVPSFRWLHMVCFREMVCHEISTIMAEDGVPVPPQCEAVLKKIWFMMDIPDNVRRIGLAQNAEVFTDNDLFFATLFFVKLDMRFTDPVTGSGKDGMRRLLMAQPGLTMLWRTLKRTALVSKIDVVKLYIRWKHQPGVWDTRASLFGIPPNELGVMQYQGWGRVGSRVELQRPDELLLKESLRRQLNLQGKYTDMFLWGYVNPRTLENSPPQIQKRPLDRLEGMEEILVSQHERNGDFLSKQISCRVLTG